MSCSLRQFYHVQSKATNAPVKKSEFIQVEGTKKCKRMPKITLVEVIKMDMSIKRVTKNMTLNKVEWRQRIHITNLN